VNESGHLEAPAEPRPTPDQPGRFRSIRSQMIAGFVLLFVPILLLLEFFSISGIPLTDWKGFQGIEIEQGFRYLDLVADTKKERLQRWLEDRKGDAHIIAHNPLLVQNLRLLQEGSARESTSKELLEMLQRVQQTYAIYSWIEIADLREGVTLVSTRAPNKKGRIDLEWFKTAPRLNETASIHLSRDATNTNGLLHIVHPITTDEGQTIALLILTADSEAQFGPLMHTGDGLGTRGEAFLFDKNLAILTHLKHPLPDGRIAQPLHDRLQTPPALLAISGREGTMDSLDYRGRPVLAAYRHIPFEQDREWGFVVQMDREETLGFLNYEIRIVLMISATALLLLLTLAWWMSSRLSRPIIQLSRVAEQFSQGDMNIRSHLNERNEIGFLSNTFDRMADTVQRTMGHLAEQTQQLNRALERQQQHQAIQEKVLQLSRVLVSARGLKDLLALGLDALLTDTRSQVGAIYIRDEEQESQFNLAHAIGMDRQDHLRAYLHDMEGGVGRAIQHKGPYVLEEIPPDTPFLHPTIAGDGVPRTIMHIPLIFQERILGVLVLASLEAMSHEVTEFLKVGQSLFSMALADALSHARTERMAEKLQQSNHELEANNQELQAQSRQLREQTAELHHQTEELRQQARELELKQRQVEKADRLKSEFLSNMSHELRTPLNSVLTLSQLMISKGVGKNPAKEREYLTVIERNGRQLLNLINDILDLSKIESGQMELTPVDMDPADTVARVIETVRPLAESKGLTLNLHTEPVPSIHCDEDKVRQILLNLLSNAIKFTSKGEVELGLSRDGGQLIFWVRDSGPGIAPEHWESIFNAFTQVDGSASRHHEGTGLGLTISRKLADMIGGRIQVQSTPGHGSTFTLILPIQPREATLPIRNHRIAPPLETAPSRILVVDDNEVARLQIRSVLEDTGYEVIETSGGMEALAALDQGEIPALVILDLMMPGMDGFEVVHQLRAQPRTAHLPILVLTAKELNTGERGMLIRNRVEELIQKGRLNRDQLLTCIRNLLADPKTVPPHATRAHPAASPVLIVEDKADNLLALTAILDDLGHSYITAGNGREAIDKTRSFKPGLVLMDMQLPIMNGFDATRSIKGDPAIKGIPVIAVTASAMKGDQERMIAAGCDDYISKPIDLTRLSTLMNKWLPARHE